MNNAVSSNFGLGYIPSLDGIRAVSISIVFFSHSGVSNLIPGGFGVTVFFFLSGFLITSLLIREKDDFCSISIWAFYLRRAIRLGPPLLITLGLSSLLVLAGLAKGDLAPAAIMSQLFFYYNYYELLSSNPMNSVEGLGILWSLAVEEHFYLFFPWIFIILLVGRYTFTLITVSLFVILLWRCFRLFILDSEEWDIYISSDTRIDSILYGCLLAFMMARCSLASWLPDKHIYLILSLGLAVLITTFVVRDPVFRSTIRYSLQGVALIPIFYFAVTRHNIWLFRPLNWKFVRRVGQYSYTLYLIHFVIILSLTQYEFFLKNVLFLTLAAGFISMCYAAAMFRFVEKPLGPLRKRLTGH